MLDYEKFAPEAGDDLAIRYTNVELRSYGSTSEAVVGRAKSESVSIWARRRVPTGWGVVWNDRSDTSTRSPRRATSAAKGRWG